jgi:hypothetical protein
MDMAWFCAVPLRMGKRVILIGGFDATGRHANVYCLS